MKKDQVITKYEQGNLTAVHILPNPAQRNEWILMFKTPKGRSYFLLSESEEIVTFNTLETAIEELREIGFKRAEIMF